MDEVLRAFGLIGFMNIGTNAWAGLAGLLLHKCFAFDFIVQMHDPDCQIYSRPFKSTFTFHTDKLADA